MAAVLTIVCETFFISEFNYRSGEFHLDSAIKEICDSEHSLDDSRHKLVSASGTEKVSSSRGHSAKSKTSRTSKSSEVKDAAYSHMPAVPSKVSQKSSVASTDNVSASPTVSTSSKANKRSVM